MMNKFKIGLALILAISYSCEDILEVPDISNQTVTVFAPLDNTVINDNAVNFNWDKVEDATSYRFQLAAPNFEAAQQLVLDSIFELDSLDRVSTRIKQTLVNGNYAWRIKALNSDYQTAYTLSNFQVDGDENLDVTPPNTPQLVAPVNGASQSEATVDFSWTREDVPGTAERDSIFIYSDESLTTLSTKALGANKAYSANLAAGTFYWVVGAYDAAGNKSDLSTTFNFTITN
ncbi:Ig-like domain-containing protein [Flagellimonas sp.]|uniref:Ig-like domain-containing protein n=1 Tax=Flagellimonas sp. TaxID=2058762 RepID=UPI003B591240